MTLLQEEIVGLDACLNAMLRHFMILHINTLDNAIVDRIWDQFLVQGSRISYNVVLALLQTHKKQLMQSDFHTVYMVLTNLKVEPSKENEFMALVAKQHMRKTELNKHN